jgi:hypothetical protein
MKGIKPMPEYGGKEKRAYLWPQGLLMVGLCSPYKLFPFVVFGRRRLPRPWGLIGILGRELKGAGERERPGSLLTVGLKSVLAVSLYLEGGSTSLGSIKHETGGSVKGERKRKPKG